MTDLEDAYRKAFEGTVTGVCECCHLELMATHVTWEDSEHRGSANLCALCAVSELARSIVFKEVTLEDLGRAIQRNTNLLLAIRFCPEENDEIESG